MATEQGNDENDNAPPLDKQDEAGNETTTRRNGGRDEERGRRRERQLSKQARARKRSPSIFARPPHCGFSLICGSHIIPRPQGVGGAGGKDNSKQEPPTIFKSFDKLSTTPVENFLPFYLRVQ